MPNKKPLDFKLSDPLEAALEEAMNRLLLKEEQPTWRDVIVEGARYIRELSIAREERNNAQIH